MRRHSAYERTVIAVSLGLLLVGIYLAARGLVSGSTAIHKEQSAAVPPNVIWCFIVNPDARPLWQPRLTSVVSLEAPDVQQPTRWLLVMRRGGQSFEVEEEVGEIRTNRIWQAQRRSDRYQSDFSIELTPVRGGTRISYWENFTFEDWIERILAPFIGLSLATEAQEGLDRLVELVSRRGGTDLPC